MEETTIRNRIYGSYVRARDRALAPCTVDGLAARRPYLRRLIRRHFPPRRDAKILDVGCGHGALVYFARQMGYRHVVGFDRSPEQVAEAHRLGIEGIHAGDLFDEVRRLPDASQDVVIAFDVIEHFTKTELVTFMDEARRVVTPEGRLILHVPNAESPFFGRVRYGDLTHEQAFTRVSIAQLVRSSGFRECAVYEDTPVIHGVASTVRAALWLAIRSLLELYLLAETGSARGVVLSQNFLVVARP